MRFTSLATGVHHYFSSRAYSTRAWHAAEELRHLGPGDALDETLFPGAGSQLREEYRDLMVAERAWSQTLATYERLSGQKLSGAPRTEVSPLSRRLSFLLSLLFEDAAAAVAGYSRLFINKTRLLAGDGPLPLPEISVEFRATRMLTHRQAYRFTDLAGKEHSFPYTSDQELLPRLLAHHTSVGRPARPALDAPGRARLWASPGWQAIQTLDSSYRI